MKTLVKTCAFALVAFSANPVVAAVTHYEVNQPNTHFQPLYPFLDLNRASKVKIAVKTGEFFHDQTMEISRVEMVFPDANNLVVTNLKFSPEAGGYVGTVNGAWVFKQVVVSVENRSGGDLFDNDFRATVRVVEESSNLNAPGRSFGPELVKVEGFAENVTRPTITDVAKLKVNDKALTLRLEETPKRGFNGEGFKVAARWMGFGESAFYLRFDGPFELAPWNKSTGFRIDSFQTPVGVDHFVAVEYKDENGNPKTTNPVPLNDLLRDAFPEVNIQFP